MAFPFDSNDMPFPGFEGVLETVQNQFWWGRNERNVFLPASISGAARDAGNTVTDVIRGGLLLGKVTATGLLKEWNPTGTDGSEVIFGILYAPLKMTSNGTNTDRYGFVMVGGNLYSDRLLIPGEANEGIVGHAQEYNVLNQLSGRFLLDRHIQYGNPLVYRPRFMTAAEVTADALTVLVSDHGRTFNFAAADGATAVTIPTPQVGLTYTFFNPVAQTVTITPAAGTFVTPGAANTAALSLTIGEQARVVGISSTLYMAEITEAATD
jgi:hypothetical protein